MTGYSILIADDEPEIRELLRLYLEKDGYRVLESQNGIETLELLKKEQVDLLVLDIMMPELDGFSVLRKVRKENNIPVLILSAKDSDADRILGLDLGADDYLTKPFNPLEAVARIHSNIRRFYVLGSGKKKEEASVICAADLMLNLDSCTLYRGEEQIELTSVEFRLMHLFMEYPGKVFTKSALFQAGWESEYMQDDNNVMVCISKLRAKLSDDGNRYIKTIRGLGYRFCGENREAKPNDGK